MIITDTHTHLYSPTNLHADRNEMIQRAINVGVSRFFIPSIDSSYTESMYALGAGSYSGKYLPDDGLASNLMSRKIISKPNSQHVEQPNSSKRKFVAIGRNRNRSVLGQNALWAFSNKIAFRRQIQLAKQLQTAQSMIHCREAFR